MPMKKRVLSALMVLTMLIFLLPSWTFAAEEDPVEVSDTGIIEESDFNIEEIEQTGEIENNKAANPFNQDGPEDVKAGCEHEWNVIEEAAPTCSEDGYTLYACSFCGEKQTDEGGQALGHDWVTGDTVAPSCISEGYTAYACARCGETKNDNFMDALGHGWIAEDVVAPTCTEQGYTLYICSRCSETKNDDLIDSFGHEPEAVIEIAATETEPGCTAGTICSVCNTILSGCERIEPLGESEETEESTDELTPDIAILTQPEDAEIEDGTAKFSVVVFVRPVGIYFELQWQRLNNTRQYENSEIREESWETLSGENESILRLTGLDDPEALLEASEYLYRCVISAGDVSAVTREAGLSANVYKFNDDVITGFADLSPDTVVLDNKPVLMVLKNLFPEEITVSLGGVAICKMDEAGNVILQTVVGAEQKSIPVDWICEQDYDDDLEEFTFVPAPDDYPLNYKSDNFKADDSVTDSFTISGFGLAPGVELPRLSVQVGDIVIGPLSGYIPTGLSVPWVGSGMRKAGYQESYIPITYDDKGNITSSVLPALRNQENEGTCWAHTAIGSIEADLIHDGRADETIDLSELYLSYYTAHNPNYPSLRNATGDRVTSDSMYLKNGGNALLSLRTMANGAGPVLESTAPYGNRSSYTPSGNEQAAYQLTRAYLMDPEDIDAIKAAISMHYGVDAGMYVDNGASFCLTDNSYYYCGYAEPNHAVMLVGWDDNFSRMNFINTPDGDGAWLVRNSWADDENKDTIGFYSYFWISYYDAGLLRDVVVAYDVESNVYDYCYAYDTFPYPAGYVSLEANTPISQTYTIKENEVIKAVGIETRNANLEGKITVAVGGNKSESHFGTTCAGFYLVSLSSPISATANSDVTVTVQFTTDADVAVEYSNNTMPYGSFTYSAICDGGGFYDGEDLSPYDARIKLYTVPDYTIGNLQEVTSISLDPSGPLTLAVRETEQLTAAIKPGNVSNKDLSWTSSNPLVARVDNGLVVGVSSGTSRITVTSRNGISAYCDVTVVDVRVTGIHLSEDLNKDSNNQKYTVYDDAQLSWAEETGDDLDLSAVPITYSYTVEPADASNKNVTWSSSDPSVVSVNASNGECRICGNGESLLAVTTQDGNFSDTVKIIVDLSTYTITYNANGGTGAPAEQIKYRYIPLVLTNTKPTRTGYSFQGWATSAEGTVICSPGESFTKNASVTLYAVWKINDPVEEFIRRCYRVILEREGEPAGVEGWTNALKSGQNTGAEIIDGFINSQEFLGRGHSNEQVVIILYRAMLGREPDASGKADWVSILNSGCSYNYIIKGFAESQEFRSICASYGIQAGSIVLTEPRDQNRNVTAFVNRNYIYALNRDGEPYGLNAWTAALISGEKTGAEIVSGFINSQEFVGRGHSNEQVITILYKTMLGREPDALGKADWVSILNSGCSYNYIIKGFSESQEFCNICASYGIRAGSIVLTEPRDQNRHVTAFVNRNYVYALNRNGEPYGLNAWTDALLKKTSTPKQVVHDFVFSQECLSKNLDDCAFLEMLYHLYLDRGSDEFGMNSWMSALRNGTTREELVQGFSESQEFKDIVSRYGL